MTQIVIELDNQLAKQWKTLVRGIDDKAALFSDFIAYHKKSIRRNIAEMQVDLDCYERTYQMPSDEFYRKFEQGELKILKILYCGQVSTRCSKAVSQSWPNYNDSCLLVVGL